MAITSDISIIIVNYNNFELLQQCLSTLINNTKGLEYEIIVVDNNSADGEIEKITSQLNDIILIKNETNEGFGKANNKGAKIAQGRYLLFLNNDTIFFENTIKKINYLYFEEKNRIDGILHKIRKDLYGLNFDEIVSPNEDIYEYFKLKEKNKKIIKTIREQIRSVYNNSEDPQSNFYGEIDMELAIQAIASHSENYAQVFNKTEEQRIEETWAILIDNSASLKLRFEDVKDFMLCLAEASDELTGPSGSWGLYSYDQKFSIIKDHKAKYNQDVRARIGGLKSGGLSYTPDAILLSGRMLMKNPADLKHLFVFTDDFPTGLWNHDTKLSFAIKEVERMGVEVIGIGLTSNISKYFTDSCYGNRLRDLVNKFIRIYRMQSSKFI